MGNLERQYGRYEAALGYYNAVLAVQPQHWRSLLNSAVALIGLRRSDEAQDALKRAIRLSGARIPLNTCLKPPGPAIKPIPGLRDQSKLASLIHKPSYTQTDTLQKDMI